MEKLRETPLQVLQWGPVPGTPDCTQHPTAPLGMATATPADASMQRRDTAGSQEVVAVAVHNPEAADAPVTLFLNSGFGHW